MSYNSVYQQREIIKFNALELHKQVKEYTDLKEYSDWLFMIWRECPPEKVRHPIDHVLVCMVIGLHKFLEMQPLGWESPVLLFGCFDLDFRVFHVAEIQVDKIIVRPLGESWGQGGSPSHFDRVGWDDISGEETGKIGEAFYF